MTVGDDLAPGLLLAAPSLNDPNFEKTVVLLGRHDAEGALGWVVNGRELAPVDELLRASGLFPETTPLPDDGYFARIACVGGPVAPATGWLVYRPAESRLPGQLNLGDELAVTGEAAAFSALISDEGPRVFRVVLGCAGWAPGQLEAEISEGAWLPAALEVDLLFEHDGDKLWDAAYQLAIGSIPAAFSGKPAKA